VLLGDGAGEVDDRGPGGLALGGEPGGDVGIRVVLGGPELHRLVVRGGDVELALKHAFYANLDRGSIFTAGAAVVLPTGKESEGMGNGFWMYEPFAMWGQFLGSNGFLQVHTGLEIPSDHDLGSNEGFVRTALGYSVSQDEGFGRVWSPMVELLVAKPAGSDTEWDVVPQVQVSLSKLQHVLLNVGVRVPLTEREDRKPRLLTYVLWDWFDGGLLDFWK